MLTPVLVLPIHNELPKTAEYFPPRFRLHWFGRDQPRPPALLRRPGTPPRLEESTGDGGFGPWCWQKSSQDRPAVADQHPRSAPESPKSVPKCPPSAPKSSKTAPGQSFGRRRRCRRLRCSRRRCRRCRRLCLEPSLANSGVCLLSVRIMTITVSVIVVIKFADVVFVF